MFRIHPASMVKHLRVAKPEVHERVCKLMREELCWHQRDEVSKRIRSVAPPGWDYVFARQCLQID